MECLWKNHSEKTTEPSFVQVLWLSASVCGMHTYLNACWLMRGICVTIGACVCMWMLGFDIRTLQSISTLCTESGPSCELRVHDCPAWPASLPEDPLSLN